METPKISAIVAFRDAAPFLPAFLTSLVNQKFTEFEAILVDDHSSDESWAITREFCDFDARLRQVRLSSGPPVGAARARRIGFNHSSGEIIHFLDADDLLDLHLFRETEKVFSRSACDVALFQFRRIDQAGGLLPSAPEGLIEIPSQRATHNSEELSTKLFQITNPALWNKAWSGELVESVQEFMEIDLAWASDLPFTYGMLSVAKKISVIDEVLYSYRTLTSSMSSSRARMPNELAKSFAHLQRLLISLGQFSRVNKTFDKLREFELDTHLRFLEANVIR